MDRFELYRQHEDLAYRFERDGPHSFARVDDASMKVVWEGPWGWVARLPVSGLVAGRPWEILPAFQDPHRPPAGIWVSRKGAKSYVYTLIHA